MKFNIEIDCTPKEARKFLGLPDVSVVQERLMCQVETQMSAALKDMASDAMLKTWHPAGMGGFDQRQKAFWAQFGGKDDK